jgi:tetratricopeptide (TPR) repeat protein
VRSKPASRPFPGSRPFLETDQHQFFGRTADATLLAEWWRNNRLAYLTGPTGRGKTSLLRAGVLPVLRLQKFNVLPVGRLSYGVSFPSAALPQHNPYTLALLWSWSPGEIASRLASRAVREFIKGQPGNGTIFAAIDQAEELLAETSLRQAHRRRFLGELKEALAEEPRLHLLVAGREEAVAIVADTLGGGVRYDLPPLSWPNAIDAISQPMISAGKSLADGAAGRFLGDLRTSRIAGHYTTERYVAGDSVEPTVLQIACAKMWDSLPTDLKHVSAKDMQRYGDVDAALTAWSGQTIAQVADEHDLSARRVASWLINTFVTEIGTRGKAYEGTTATAGMPNAVARVLVDRHLLTSRLESGTRWYQLLDDRLIEPLRRATSARAPVVEPADYLQAAEHALVLGELDLAKRYAEEIQRSPAGHGRRLDAQACSLLGNLAYEHEKPGEAEARYREAARQYTAAGDSKAVAFQLAAIGQTLIAQGRVSEAVEELHSALVRQPDEPVLQTELAQALWQDDKGPAALAVLNNVLSMDGGDRAALRIRGEILAYLGEAHDAIRDLDRVDPLGHPSIRAARGLALVELGDRPAARRELENAMAEGRRNGPVLLYAARAFALSGDDVTAQELAEQASNATDPPLSPQHRERARRLANRR